MPTRHSRKQAHRLRQGRIGMLQFNASVPSLLPREIYRDVAKSIALEPVFKVDFIQLSDASHADR